MIEVRTSVFDLTDEELDLIAREGSRLKVQLERARLAGNEATLTLRQWLTIIDQYQGFCAFCQAVPLEVMEHLQPVQIGGGTTAENCVPACIACNTRKGIRSASFDKERGILVISQLPGKRQKRVVPLTLETEEDGLTIQEAAQQMNVANRTIWRWIAKGKFPYYQAGPHGSVRILKKDLQAMWKLHNGERS